MLQSPMLSHTVIWPPHLFLFSFSFFFKLKHSVAKPIFITSYFHPKCSLFAAPSNPILKLSEIAPIVFIPRLPVNAVIYTEISERAWHEPPVTYLQLLFPKSLLVFFHFFFQSLLHRNKQLQSVDSASLNSTSYTSVLCLSRCNFFQQRSPYITSHFPNQS